MTVVFSGGSSPSTSPSAAGGGQPSSTASRASRRKRFTGLKVAPRPLSGSGGTGGPAPMLAAELRVHRDGRVEDARQGAVGLRTARDLGEFCCVDFGHLRPRCEMDGCDRPSIIDLF